MEDKKFIIGLLTTNAEEFVRFVESRSQEKFTESLNGKWSVGQNIDHLIRSLSPVNRALALPSFVLRIAFGKPNRTPRGYQELVDRYHQKLAAGGRASARFIPTAISWQQKTKMIADFTRQKEKMTQLMDIWTENQLDNYLLPHPLLGKLTLREMLFFSAYHIQHHLGLLELRDKNG